MSLLSLNVEHGKKLIPLFAASLYIFKGLNTALFCLLFLALSKSSIHAMINPLRPRFLKPWSFLVVVSVCFLIGICLSWRGILRNGHGFRWKWTGDPSPGMTLGAVFHHPSVIWLTSTSLFMGTPGEQVWRLSGVKSREQSAGLKELNKDNRWLPSMFFFLLTL